MEQDMYQHLVSEVSFLVNEDFKLADDQINSAYNSEGFLPSALLAPKSVASPIGPQVSVGNWQATLVLEGDQRLFGLGAVSSKPLCIRRKRLNK
jgi:hypothetical protein